MMGLALQNSSGQAAAALQVVLEAPVTGAP